MERLSKYLHRNEAGLWLTENERNHLRISYHLKSVIFEKISRFQHVMIADSYDFGKMLVLDGVVQTTSLDGYIYNEIIAHVPLSLHPHPRNVLVIGGGDCGVAGELCKYREVEQITMVEIDELVVHACKTYLPEISGGMDEKRVKFIYADGVEYVKEVHNRFDVIIIDSSDPVGPAKQLFEPGFYRNVHSALKDDGIMVCQSQSPIFHKDIMRQTYFNIRSLFPHVRLYTSVVPTYPGGIWSFTLGSKKPIASGLKHPFDKPAQYVNDEILRSCFHLPQFIKNELKATSDALT